MAARSEPDQRLRVVDPSAVPRRAEGYRQWWEENTDVPYGYCWCGCGERTTTARFGDTEWGVVRGEPRRFLMGHAAKLLHKVPTVEEYRQWWEENTDVPYGHCWCGCGQRTGISDVTNASEHYFKGEPFRYVRGHRHRAHPSEVEAYKREWREEQPDVRRLLSSTSLKGMGPSLAIGGTTTREVFEAYVEQILAPTLRAGQVVAMDNLAVHKSARARELVEAQGRELLFLPPYSPDLNPIEEAFSKMKGLLRRIGARTREALVEAMSQAICAVTARDALGFFEHCGYRIASQPL